jgi:hypothetical protein
MDAIEIRAARSDDADAVAHYHDRCFTNTLFLELLVGEPEAPDRTTQTCRLAFPASWSIHHARAIN